MGFNFRRFSSGIQLVPRSDGSTAPTIQGEIAVSSADGHIYYNNGSANVILDDTSSANTLTNKTIVVSSNFITSTVNRVAQFNSGSGNLEASSVTNTELGYVSGVTSSIQGQLNSITGSGITSLTGDVVASGPGAAASTIQAHVVSNSKLAQMAAHTYKGNNTGSTADAADITNIQLTADLNQFSSTLQGLTPASGGGTTNFLRADGTWTSAFGQVTNVTASGPLASSGGSTPNISLTSVVPVTLGGTGLATLTANNVILGNGTSTPNFVAPSTSGNLLTSNGTTWISSTPTGFPVNQVVTSSSGTFPVVGAGFSPVTNLSATLTTTGKPVHISFQPATSGTCEINLQSGGGIVFAIFRDGVQLFTSRFTYDGINLEIPPGFLNYIDPTPTAASHT